MYRHVGKAHENTGRREKYSEARPQKKPTLVMSSSLQSSGRRGILLFKVSVPGTVLWHP